MGNLSQYHSLFLGKMLGHTRGKTKFSATCMTFSIPAVFSLSLLSSYLVFSIIHSNEKTIPEMIGGSSHSF